MKYDLKGSENRPAEEDAVRLHKLPMFVIARPQGGRGNPRSLFRNTDSHAGVRTGSE